MKNLKFLFFCSIFIFFAFNIYSQNNIPKFLSSEDRSRRVLEKAELAYDIGNYDDAVYLVEKAKENRNLEIDWTVNILTEALKPVAVQKVGDEITDVLVILNERNSKIAVNVIEEIIDLLGIDYFNNSINNLLTFIKKFYNYPEADYLSGKLFFLEGEYSLSKEFFLKAWQNRDVLDIPNIKYDILYDIAKICELQEDYDDYEKTLLLIIFDEQEQLNNDMLLRSFEIVKTPDDFFNMFRNNNYFSLNALILLCDFYKKNNENKKALEMSLTGVITAISRIEEVLKERDYTYKYTTVENLFKYAVKYSDINEWATKNNIWKGFYDFATLALKNNKLKYADTFFNCLYFYCPDKYWMKMSFSQLLKINH